MNRAQQKAALFVVLVAALLALLWWSNGSEQDAGPPSRGLSTVTVDELPDEAAETIELIERGGPFPYPRNDGVTFRNDEGLLPEHPRGFYREYTVPTPGEADRGARRIVTGGDTMYWTPDHYQSFARIVE